MPNVHRVSEKIGHFYFCDNFGKKDQVFTVKFIKDLRGKLQLKLPPPLNFVAALPCEM